MMLNLNPERKQLRHVDFLAWSIKNSIKLYAEYHRNDTLDLADFKFPVSELFSKTGITASSHAKLALIRKNCDKFVRVNKGYSGQVWHFSGTDEKILTKIRPGFNIRNLACEELLQMSETISVVELYEQLENFSDCPELEDFLKVAILASDTIDGLARRAVDICVQQKEEVVKILSRASMWRADGSLVTAKAQSALKTKVSIVFMHFDSEKMVLLSEAMGWSPSMKAVAVKNSGLEFEGTLKTIFDVLGIPCETTDQTGDFGVDLVATMNGTRYAIQAKDHASEVGVGAIQEVVGGAHHHNCSRTVVVAKSGFTDAAETLAKSTGTRLLTANTLRSILHDRLVTLLNTPAR